MHTGAPADAPTGADLRPDAGTRLGKYELVRRLAIGGMAEIFLARTTAMHGFEKIVVLKRILPQHAENDEFIQMFLDEARLAATLAHANIVQVYDIGEHDGQYFFTMEYVEGQDLRRIVKQARAGEGSVPLEHVLNIVIGTAAGLHYAHEQVDHKTGQSKGIVHRDVSPSNILVTYNGGVKLVDFGIAKASTAQVNTVAGTLKGKIPYMSPEQCRGEKLDRRSDVFSLGTLLWEMSTGSRLFRGENEFATLNRIANGDVPLPTTRVEGYPPELEAIVMKALQRYPDDRYDTAQDMQVDLEDFAREHKLAVSSAKLARYMRSSFGEEIKRSQTMTAVDIGKLARRTQSLDDDEIEEVRDELGLYATEPADEDATAAFTPSELGIKVPQTPVPGSQVTHTGALPADDLLDELPPTQPWGKIAAIAAGILFLIGGAFAIAGGDDDEPAADEAKAAPRVIETQVFDETPRPVLQPAPVEPETKAPEPEQQPAKPKPKPKAKRKSKPKGKTTSKPKPKRRKKKKSQAWDPNSPLPPPG